MLDFSRARAPTSVQEEVGPRPRRGDLAMPCVGGIPAQKVLRHRDVERAVLPGRVLVMLAGSLRGTEHSWTTIIERLILPHRATLMMILAKPLVQALPRNSKDVTDSAFRRAVLISAGMPDTWRLSQSSRTGQMLSI